MATQPIHDDRRCRHLLSALCLLSTLALSPVASASELTCGRISIDGTGHGELSNLQQQQLWTQWAELDDNLLACGDSEIFYRLADAGWQVEALWHEVDPHTLYIVRGAHPGVVNAVEGTELLATGGPYSLLRATTSETTAALSRGHLPSANSSHPSIHRDPAGCGRSHVEPFQGRQILARQSANRPPRRGTDFGDDAEAAAAAVDGDRWFGDIETLAGWNRHTHGTEIDAARDWLVSRFEAIGGLSVSTQSFQVGSTTAENVIAVRPGSSRPDDWILVGGHYDATSENTGSAAPGAEDNASGCAGVVELARVAAAFTPEASLIFLCYSGEEQGLHGSVDHASRLVSAGDDSKVRLMINMDMIAYTGDSDLDCLLETSSDFPTLPDVFVDAAAAFTTLRTVVTLFAFGSDHVPYLNRDMPALLTIENDWDNYPSYHRTSDLPANLTQDMGYQVLRMNAAVLIHTAGSSSALFTDGFESGGLAAWPIVVP